MRQAYWEAIARRPDSRRGWGGSFHRRLTQIYRYLVSPHQRVLEVGCGQGDHLAALIPLEGVGADFSPAMVRRASSRHPENKRILADAHDLSQLDGLFDTIILSDLVNDLWDVQRAFQEFIRQSSAQAFCLQESLGTE